MLHCPFTLTIAIWEFLARRHELEIISFYITNKNVTLLISKFVFHKSTYWNALMLIVVVALNKAWNDFVLSIFMFRNDCFHSFIENTKKKLQSRPPFLNSFLKWKTLTQKSTTTWIFKDFCCSSGIPTNINFFVMFILATWRKSEEGKKKTKEKSNMKFFLEVVTLLYKQNCSTLHVKGRSLSLFQRSHKYMFCVLY